ncbi:MAG: hypothetical protein AB7U79_00040 [Candidatus Izemoplasmatales bacterium]
MKKVFSNFIVFLSLILVIAVAIPWNNLGQWGINYPILADNELYIKGGIAGVLLLFGIIFLIVSNIEYSNNGTLSRTTAGAAFYPLWMYSVAATILALVLALFVYLYLAPANPTSLYTLGGIGLYLLNLLGFGHVLSSGFRIRKNFTRVMIFVFLFELAIVSAGLAYYMITLIGTAYAGLNTYNYVLVAAVFIVFYIAHLILLAVKKNRVSEEELLETEVYEIEKGAPKVEPTPEAKPRKAAKRDADAPKVIDPRKSIIVGKDQAIISKQTALDPTEMLYEDVNIDPEFTKTAGTDRQVSSIDYYIEKPKMFKPLDPTFDMLVEYVREFPGVVTKIADEKITFYVDRNPFLVLMNYGNYYRIGFKYDLEKGIRLIIKYPTISKNKSTKDDLWFKANNYGDLPKEVVYQIVKASFENASK